MGSLSPRRRWNLAATLVCFTLTAAIVTGLTVASVSAVEQAVRPTDIVPSPTRTTWWVTDSANGLLLQLNGSGLTLGSFDAQSSGSPLRNPQAVSVDATGNVYVADTNNHRIVVFSPTGDVVRTIGSYGTSTGKLNYPSGVAVDGSGRVWVADTVNNRLQRFSAVGVFEASYSTWQLTTSPVTSTSLLMPRGLSVAGSSIYVADAGNRRVLKIGTASGVYEAAWGITLGSDSLPTTSRFATPVDVCIGAGFGVVADMGAASIESLDPVTGARIMAWGSFGTGSTQFKSPQGVWSDGSSVWIADTGNARILKHSTTGTFQDEWSLTTNVVDLAPPVTTSSVTGAWRNTVEVVTLTSIDVGSGVSKIEYRIGDGSPQTYSGPFPVDGEGEITVTFFATDVVGNVESPKTATVRIDKTPPATTSSVTGVWRSTSETVTLTSTDSRPGVAKTEYRIGDGALQAYGGPFRVDGEGEIVVSFFARDVAGNVESPKTATVRIDKTAPVTTSSITGTWRSTPETVTLTSADARSGVGTTEYRIGGGSLQTYGGPFPVDGEGEITVTFFATDAVGNTESTKTATVRIDKTAPASTSSATGAWRSTPETVTLSSTDGGSGVSRIQYRHGSVGLRTYSGPFVISDEGESTITYFGTDVAGNVESNKTAAVKIDTMPPVTVASVGDLQPAGTRLVTLYASDDGIGVDATFYSVNGSAIATYTAAFAAPAEDSTVVEFWSVDRLGHVESRHEMAIQEDVTPPTTTATGLSDAWRTAPAVVSLEAVDTGSGVRNTYYRLGLAGAVTTYTAPFAVNTDGSTRVTYWSVDNKGLREGDKFGWVRIDLTPPESTATVTVNELGTSASVLLESTDTGSGVDRIEYRFGSAGDWLTYSGALVVDTPGDHLIQYRAVDEVGRVETTRVVTVGLRGVPPTTSSSIDGEWHRWDVMVSLVPSYEGTAPVTTHYRVGSGPEVLYEGPFSVTGEGQTQVTYWSEALGVAEQPKSAAVRIDRTPPTTTYSQMVSTSPNRVTVTLAASDAAGSGVEGIYYRQGSSAVWTRYTAPFDVDRASTVWYRSVDNVGNEEVAQFRAIPPVTKANRSSTYWYRSTVAVSLTATHPAGAPVVTYYRLSGMTTAVQYTAPITISKDGVRTIYFWSVSEGVVESEGLRVIHLDKTKPTISSLSSPTHPKMYRSYRSRNVRLKWKGYDKTSGVARYAVKLDRYSKTKPSTKKTTTATTKYYTGLKSGTWYFHVRAKDKAGNWGPTRHFKIRIR